MRLMLIQRVQQNGCQCHTYFSTEEVTLALNLSHFLPAFFVKSHPNDEELQDDMKNGHNLA